MPFYWTSARQTDKPSVLVSDAERLFNVVSDLPRRAKSGLFKVRTLLYAPKLACQGL